MITYELLNHFVDIGRIIPLVADHTTEMNGPDSNFDVQHLMTILNAGIGRIFVVRIENEIVGYSIYILSRDLFYAHVKQAECVAIYVNKTYRGSNLAKRLIAFGETYLRDKDQVNRVIATTNNDERFQRFYERSGYKAVNVQVTKDF